ncbi:MAG: response regulator [Geobacteraceae bacterium]|nr:MAG: response regulator [Geobacteraceae bacterium]
MPDIAKLQKILDAALKQTGEESSMLLGQTLSANETDTVNTDKKSFFAGMDDAIFVAEVESKEEYPGQIHMIFSLRDAILLSGMLLGIPPARISEKRKLAIMEPDDCDAFGEIMNQIIGSFNSVFKPSFPNKVHLKLLPPKKFIPGMDELTEQEPFPEDDYLLFRAPLNMEGVEMDRLDILMPLSLANLFAPGKEVKEETAGADEQLEGVSGETGTASAVPRAVASEETILILDDDEPARRQAKDFLAVAGLKGIDAPLGEDIRELISRGDAKVVVIGVADTEDRELALCIKINALCQGSPIPIIMCATEWTRTGVLKALKYGARDIIVKPYNADELVAKINKFLIAA